MWVLDDGNSSRRSRSSSKSLRLYFSMPPLILNAYAVTKQKKNR